MTDLPEISVVMGVYNGGAYLRETMDSVLSQEGPRLEFVVVDDGSCDATAAILEDYATRDGRVRVRRQGRLGLTRALISGCAAARSPIIARQDCGDVSLPGRLAQQLARLRAAPGATLVSVGAEVFGPRGEWLYDVRDSDASLDAGLSRADLATTRGPSHHGATMFRRQAYDAVGGYRAAFAVAQDLDLWMRLWERGPAVAVEDVLYRARLHKESLSATRRPEQVAARRAIIESARARRGGHGERVVDLCAVPRHQRKPQATAASFNYFVARALEAREPESARNYLSEALRAKPLFPRAWLALARLSARALRARWRPEGA